MQVPVFRAKDRDSNEMVEGFYCEYPVTNVNVNSDGVVNADANSPIIQSNVAHCLLTYKPGMMGLINEPVGCTIDLATLEFVKFVEVPCKTNSIII